MPCFWNGANLGRIFEEFTVAISCMDLTEDESSKDENVRGGCAGIQKDG